MIDIRVISGQEPPTLGIDRVLGESKGCLPGSESRHQDRRLPGRTENLEFQPRLSLRLDTTNEGKKSRSVAASLSNSCAAGDITSPHAASWIAANHAVYPTPPVSSLQVVHVGMLGRRSAVRVSNGGSHLPGQVELCMELGNGRVVTGKIIRTNPIAGRKLTSS